MALRQPIAEFYQNKTLFITGGTGFLGKALTEKLLRSFPQIKKIYLLVRPKYGISASERSKEYLKNEVFYRLRSIYPNCHQKLGFIEGDLKNLNLGMSERSLDLIKNNVNVFIHAGSLVNFNVDLHVSILHHLIPTRDLLDIAADSKNTQSYVYVSTAYCQGRQSNRFTTETLYKHPVNPRELIKLVETLPKNEFMKMEKNLMDDFINTYLYCKNATENLVHKYIDKFPVTVFRPGNIMPSLYEPFPYWSDSKHGLIRVIEQANQGWICPKATQYNSNSIPVDMTANCLIAAGTNSKKGKIEFYNYTLPSGLCSYFEAVQYSQDLISDKEKFYKNLKYNYWLQMKKYISEKTNYQFKDVMDMATFDRVYEVLRIFNENEFNFAYGNVTKLWESLSEEEKGLLFFDLRTVDWKRYFTNISIK